MCKSQKMQPPAPRQAIRRECADCLRCPFCPLKAPIPSKGTQPEK